MKEKDMVNDILSTVNSSLTGYANVIAQAANPQLRQTIIDIRNRDETFQYELFKLAQQKGYYQPAQQADQNEVTQIKTMFNTGS